MERRPSSSSACGWAACAHPEGSSGAGGTEVLREAGLRYCSPAGSGAGAEAGVALLPFQWRHLDASCVLPPLAAAREQMSGSNDPVEPGRLRRLARGRDRVPGGGRWLPGDRPASLHARVAGRGLPGDAARADCRRRRRAGTLGGALHRRRGPGARRLRTIRGRRGPRLDQLDLVSPAMSALGDVAAALLPPEEGGPDPERVAGVARRMVDRMPTSSQAGLGAALLGLEAFSLVRTGRTLGAASPAQRRGDRQAGRPPRWRPRARRLQVDRPARPRHRRLCRRDRRDRLAPRALAPRPGDEPHTGGGVARPDELRCGRDRLGRWWSLRRPRPGPGRARHRDRRGGRALDGRAHSQLPPARPLRRDLPRRRHDHGARQPADRAAAGARRRRHHGDQLRHLLPPAGQGGTSLARAPRAGPRRPRAARPASRRRRSDARRRPGADGGAGPQRRTGARGRRGARLAERAPAPQRSRLPRRLPVRDRLPQQRQGRRPPQRPARGLRGRGANRLRAAREAGAHRGRPGHRRAGAARRRGAGADRGPAGRRRGRRRADPAPAAPQRLGSPSPPRPQSLDPPGDRDHGQLRGGSDPLARSDAERRHRGAARARGGAARGDLHPTRHGRRLGPRLRNAPDAAPRSRRRTRRPWAR